MSARDPKQMQLLPWRLLPLLVLPLAPCLDGEQAQRQAMMLLQLHARFHAGQEQRPLAPIPAWVVGLPMPRDALEAAHAVLPVIEHDKGAK